MVKVCCVPYCRSRNTSDNNILFHPFPLSKVLRKQWSLVVQQHARKSPRHPLVIKEHTTVCSKHFSKTDYWKAGNVLTLRKNAVPTIFNIQENEDNILSKQKSEPNHDTVLKKNKLKQPFQNTTKPVLTVKIRPKQLRYLDKKKAKDSKEVKNIEDPQNWRNLLFITKDHAYAALWQNESINNNKKDNSSEDDTDNDELKDVPYATNVVKDTINLNMLVHEAEVQCATTISEKPINTDILLQESDVPCATNVSEDTTIPDMVLHKPDLPCTTDATDMLAQEAVVLSPNETVVEEAPPMSSNESNTEICSDTETQNKMQLVNTDTHQLSESVFLKEEIIEECPLNNEQISICKGDNSIQKSNSVNETIDSQKVTIVATNEQNKNVVNTNANTNTLPAKLPKRVNTISKKNLPEICILCATANMTRKNYTLIVHFAAIIMDLSGVDILKSNVAPIACNVCFKNVLEMWNFKQQIVAADKFISENIPKQLPIHINSRNLPKPPGTTFEYIDCDKQNINNTLIDTKNQRQPENVDLSKVTLSKQSSINQNNLTSVVAAVPKSKSDLPKMDNGITLVPIEDILKDNNINGANDIHYNDRDSAESSEDFSDLPTCTDCGLTLENINTKNCDCKKMCLQIKVGKNDTQQEKFVCSTCGKQYPFLRSLKRHEVTHKQKQCLCTVCGQVFHFHLYLKRHMRKHSGKKPFACPYCNKKFSSQWNLSQHKRLHTNSLPYECKVCPTAFRHNVTLKKHVRMFHTADQMFRNSQHTGTPSAISNGNN